ncbi:MAG: hypothetical protein ACK544_05185, partial [Microcystis sp.]
TLIEFYFKLIICIAITEEPFFGSPLDKNKKNFLIFLNLLIYNDGTRNLAPGQIKLGLFFSLTINKKNRTPPSN